MNKELGAPEAGTVLRRRALLQLGAASVVAASAGVSPAFAAMKKSARERRPIIIDALGGISNSNYRNMPNIDGADIPAMGIDARAISDALASGLSAFNVTLGYVAGPQEPFEDSVKEIAAWDALIRRKSDVLLKVQTVDDIRRTHENKKLGAIYGFQNVAMMGDNASRVEIFANLGVRVIQLTYNVSNQLGDGSMAPDNRGLTNFGRKVVAELNKNNVLVDLSHSGEQTCLDAIEASQKPIAITHTGCRAVTDLPRNKTDAELRGVAQKGGVVGIYFMPFLAIGRQSMAEDLVKHIEHAVNICGEDHVGIGTDGSVTKIDDMPAYREGIAKEVLRRRAMGIGAAGETQDIVPLLPDLQGKDKFWKLADMLQKRGYSAAQTDKILGGNFLRLMGEIW